MRATLLPLLLAACAATPRPDPQLTAITASPSAPAAQAYQVCEPRARLASERARPAARATTTCRTFAGTTTCTEEPQGPMGFAEGFNAARAPREAYRLTLSSCLAEYGWALR